MKFQAQTLRVIDACTDPINLTGKFTVSVIGSGFKGTATIHRSLDAGETWETAKDTEGRPVDVSMNQGLWTSLDVEIHLDEPLEGVLFRGQMTAQSHGSVIIRFDQM